MLHISNNIILSLLVCEILDIKIKYYYHVTEKILYQYSAYIELKFVNSYLL